MFTTGITAGECEERLAYQSSRAYMALLTAAHGGPPDLDADYRRYVDGKPWVRPSLHHIDLARSDALEPPWPDLIITVGRRPSMAATGVTPPNVPLTKASSAA